MTEAERIVDYCMENRVSTTEVADALSKTGVLQGVLPMNTNQYRVGPVRPIFAAYESNYSVHEQIKDVQKGEVIIIFTHSCNGRAILGELVSKYVLLYRKAAALVIIGAVRDAAGIRRQGYPVWSTGVTPLGCFNTPAEPFPIDLEQKLREEYTGAIAVCDDGGVTVIPKQKVNEQTLEKLHRIEMQEDLWFFCLDTLKWDTHKIVCEKAYLTDQEFLSKAHKIQIDELSKPFDQK